MVRGAGLRSRPLLLNYHLQLGGPEMKHEEAYLEGEKAASFTTALGPCEFDSP